MKKVRGFEVLPDYQGLTHVKIPTRSTKWSAGYDIHVIEDLEIAPHGIALMETGLTAYMQADEWLGLYIRSGTAYKYEIILANGVGVIDADYYGKPIKVMVRNLGDQPLQFRVGERVAQAVFQKYLLVDEDTAAGERAGGFGSTGV